MSRELYDLFPCGAPCAYTTGRGTTLGDVDRRDGGGDGWPALTECAAGEVCEVWAFGTRRALDGGVGEDAFMVHDVRRVLLV